MKKIFSKKKKLKGMTLAEIVISLAVLAVLTVLLVGTSRLIDNYTRSANKVNNKVAVQTPVAEARYMDKAYRIDSSGTSSKIKITLNNNCVFEGDGYVTVDPNAPVDENELGGNLGLKFIDDPQYVVPHSGT